MSGIRTVVVGLSVLLAACGGGSDQAGNGGNGGNGNGGEEQVCHPSGTALSIQAESLAFSVDCLAAPAGEAFTIDFENKESQPHNVSIQDGGSAVFVGEIITGPSTVTYEVEAMEAGTYAFQCDVHPQMKGAFIVE